MSLRQKIVLLTVLPMLLGMSLVAFLVNKQARQLSEQQSAVFSEALLDIYKAELVSFTRLARSSLTHIVENPQLSDAEKREQAIKLLTDLAYADDGYFYVYTKDGDNIVHPKQPYRIGKNWWDLTDSEGKPIIQELIQQADNGGGFTTYLWEQPSSGQISKKLGYAESLHDWDWMFGTGVYIDPIDQKKDEIDAIVNNQIRSTSLVIIGIAAAAVVAVVLCGLALQLNELKSADQKLQLLTKRVIDTQDEERRRVSRELHDGINQRLVAIKYSLEEAKTAANHSTVQSQNLIDASENHIDDTIVEVRRMSHDLHPSILDDLGLMVAVEALVEQFSKRTGIEVSLVKVPFRNLLATPAKTALYRVTQEALTNIERHAEASKVDIVFELNDDWFQLNIRDNGKGFDEQALARKRSAEFGLGLRNMAERVGYFHGRFDIRTSVSGTNIRAAIPRSSLNVRHQATQAS